MLRSSYAQLANHLHPFAAAYAWCLEHGHEFRTPGFARYARYFSDLGDADAGVFAQAVGWRLTRWAQKSRLFGPTLVAPATGPVTNLPPSPTDAQITELAERMKGRGQRVFLQGWRFRNPMGIAAHRALVLEKFRPSAAVAESVRAFAEGLPDGRPVIGVHIRHADYRTHRGGALFVSLGRTLEHMKALANRLVRLRPYFVVFSDESRSPGEFAGFDHIISRGNAGEDLFRMANCHAIIGPHSSFNAWAAWYGDRPLMHIAGDSATTEGPPDEDLAMRGLRTLHELTRALHERGWHM